MIGLPGLSTDTQAIGPGHLVLIVGPSGAGKDTVIREAKARCADDSSVIFPRRVVTRTADASEDHDSIADGDFDDALRAGAFAFWWQAHGLRYGIPAGIDTDIRAGRAVICNVSRGVVADVRSRYARVTAVLVTAPPDILSARLAARSRDSDGSLLARLKRNDAFSEFRADQEIVNIGAPAEAAGRLLALVR